MATAEAVELLIRGRDESAAVFNSAIRRVLAMNAAASKTGNIVKVNFGEVSRALSIVSPQAAHAASQISAVQAATAGFGAAASTAAVVATGLGLAIAAVGAAALVSAKALGEKVERLDNLSAATGTSISSLQVLAETFRRAGLGAEAADASLIRLNKAIAEQNPLLAELGITAKDPVEALLQLSQAFKGSNDEAAKTKIAFELMGRGSADVLKVIDGLAESFPGLREEMASTGQLMTTDMVDAGRKFDEEWDRFTGRWEGFMNRIGGAAAEAANAIIDAFSKPANAEEAIKRQANEIEKQIRVLSAMVKEERDKLQDTSGGFAGLDDLFFGAGAGKAAAEQRIRELNARIAQLDVTLRKVKGTAREFGEDDLPLIGDVGEPSVDRVAAAMDSLDKKTKGAEISMRELQQALAEPGLILRDIERRPTARPPKLEPSEKVREIAPQLGAMEEAQQRFIEMLDELTSAAGIFEATAAASFFGVASAFGVVTDTIISGGNVMKLRLIDIFRSMVDQLLRELNRFLAARAVLFFLRLFGGPVGQVVSSAFSAGTGAPGVVTGGPRSFPTPVPDVTRALPPRTVEVNMTVSTLDSRSFSDFMQSPRGGGRLAEIAEAAQRPV